MNTDAATDQDPAAPPPPTLDWTDHAAVEAWARDLCTQMRDALSAGEDATRPPRKRELGQRAARRLIRQAEKNLAGALAFAGIDVKNV
jgi:hypothetical protein